MNTYANLVLVTNPALQRHPNDVPYIALRSTVAACLAKTGLIPVAVGPAMDESVILWLYEQCASVVFTGGADWNPKWYNQERAKETLEPHDARDTVEQLLYARALADKKPMVGICRGMQGLAIALYRQHAITAKESILIQHIGEFTKMHHDAAYESMHQNKQEVTITLNTIAHEIFQRASIRIPKAHHQAVDKHVVKSLLPHVIISGVSTEDGFAEIMELKRSIHPFCFAVQGHPEVDVMLYLPIFRRLKEEAERFIDGQISPDHSRLASGELLVVGA